VPVPRRPKRGFHDIASLRTPEASLGGEGEHLWDKGPVKPAKHPNTRQREFHIKTEKKKNAKKKSLKKKFLEKSVG